MGSKSNITRYEIYEEELEELTYKPVGFFDKIFYTFTRKVQSTAYLTYEFSVSVSEFLRGELFCDDVSEAMESQFTQRDLISLLLEDFLYQAKHKNNPHDLYYELDIRSEQVIQISRYDGSNKTLTFNGQARKLKMKSIECSIKRKDALRLEVMLSDIAELNKEKEFSVHDVLKIIYSDFIKQYKNGNLNNVIENIIKRMS